MTTQLSGLTIRPFTNSDYEALARLWNATFMPSSPQTAEELQFDDQHRPAQVPASTLGGGARRSRSLAIGMYDQMLRIYHPRKFTVDVLVEPAYQSAGHWLGRCTSRSSTRCGRSIR